MQTLAQILQEAARQIAPVSDSPRQDAEWLLAHRLGYSRAQLFTRLNDTIEVVDASHYTADVRRRARGEPVAYVTGRQGFWTFEVTVSPAVLVPRPETELLVEWALERMAACEDPPIADLGTGSGVIALALKLERPDAALTGVDCSAEALGVARSNARALQADIDWVEADFAEWLLHEGPPQQLIVSNPPYIAGGDAHLPALRFEPLIALTDGHDGLNALRQIIAQAPQRLLSGGSLLVEHGYDQGPDVRVLFDQAGFQQIETRTDLGGQPRATGGYRR